MDHCDVPPKHEVCEDDLANYSLQLMWRLRQYTTKIVAACELTPVKALVLELVGCGYTQPKSLATFLGVAQPAITVCVNELVERGLLIRQVDTTDRRRIQLTLTADGRVTCRKLSEAWKDVYKGHRINFSAEELELLGRLLSDMSRLQIR